MGEGVLNGYYPVMLQIKGKRIVVAGGGQVAERKIAGLLEAGADDVLVASPDATERIREWERSGRLAWKRALFSPADMDGASLAMAATDNKEVNAQVAAEAARKGIWCNIADAGGQSGFITPAVLRRGDLIIAVTASGASPSLAAIVKRQLAQRYGDRLTGAAIRLRELRERALEEVEDAETRRLVLRLAAEELLLDGDDGSGASAGEANSGLVPGGADAADLDKAGEGGAEANSDRSGKTAKEADSGKTGASAEGAYSGKAGASAEEASPGKAGASAEGAYPGKAGATEGNEDVRRWLLRLLERTKER